MTCAGSAGPRPGTEHRQQLARSREQYRELADRLATAAAVCRDDPYVAHLQAEQAHLEIMRIELEEIDVRLGVGERATAGEPARPTEEAAQRILSRQRQWGIAQTVPAAIRGEAFGALAP